jgi:uncharacterized membrane protein
LLKEYIATLLWSFSPFGEAKFGIPYGILHDLNPVLVLVVAILGNIAVYPAMLFFLAYVNKWLAQWHWYRSSAIWVARRAKKGSKTKLEKYGYIGLALFVMVPTPGSGVYIGSIITFLLRLDYRKAFIANAIGAALSCTIVWSITCIGIGLF